MKNLKRAAATIGAAAVLVGFSSTAATADDKKEPNLGPYNCTLPLPLLQEEDPLLALGVMCKGPIKDEGKGPAKPGQPPVDDGSGTGQPPADDGSGEFPPGQDDDGKGPGNSDNAPGHDENGPGNSENAPGHNKGGLLG